MSARINMDRVARGLGAQRRGEVQSEGGYFGALQLAADVQARFHVPARGGRPTDPSWTERRLVPLAPRTLARLEQLTAEVRTHAGVNVEPMQLAAVILERTTERLTEDEVEELVQPRGSRR